MKDQFITPEMINANHDVVDKVGREITDFLNLKAFPPRECFAALMHITGLIITGMLERGELPCPECGDVHTKKEPHLKLVKDDTPTPN